MLFSMMPSTTEYSQSIFHSPMQLDPNIKIFLSRPLHYVMLRYYNIIIMLPCSVARAESNKLEETSPNKYQVIQCYNSLIHIIVMYLLSNNILVDFPNKFLDFTFFPCRTTSLFVRGLHL